ncbi:hypothetical protein V6N11_007819 [Hibiscus sabdariffa]|uniref:Uncharacterized protein n=1 Tax=Hibiscus sabdariffa TaxID=183260 RepID=A0ABR2NJX2_9ROSI
MFDTMGNFRKGGTRLFRYVAAWNDHPAFPEFFRSVWDNSRGFYDNVNRFQEGSRRWSMDVFGHINKRKNRLMTRLRGIDKAMEVSFRHLLSRLEVKLKRELDEVLEQENRLW